MNRNNFYPEECLSVESEGNFATNTPQSTKEGYDSGYSTGKSVESNSPFLNQSEIPLPVFSLCSPISETKSESNNDIRAFKKSARDRVRVVPRYGCEVGVECVDFIKELQHYSPVISKIINYLDKKDVNNAQKVSELWSKTISGIFNSKHVISPIKSPENQRKRAKSEADDNRFPLENIENKLKNLCISSTDKLSVGHLNQKTPNKMNENNALYEKFKEEGKKLISCEHLWPCPRCNSPARITPIVNRGHCSQVNCQYDFCSNCTTDFHGELPCPVKPITNGKIGLKKNRIGSETSKKNLRRL